MITAFLTGCIQVFLVAYQGRQIAAYQSKQLRSLWPIGLVGLTISAVWVFNVRAAAGRWYECLAYILGAGCGTLLAMKVRLKQ